MNLAEAFGESVRKHAEKIALFWGEREFSYSELWEQTLVVSEQLLKDFGVKHGDRVGLWLKNCPEFVPSFFGIISAGAVVVPINNFLKPDEVSYIVADAGIEVLITDQELSKYLPALIEKKPRLRSFITASEDASKNRRDGRDRRDERAICATPQAYPHADPIVALRPTLDPRPSAELAVLIYTSGTTGRPKGAMLSHANLLSNVESCRHVLKTVEADRLAVLLPLFHSYMLTVGLLLPLLVGGSIVLVKSLHPLAKALQEILARRATVLPGIPQFFRAMIGAPLPLPLPLRLCVSGAAPLPAQVLSEFEAKFHIPLIEGYGLSEASPVVTKNPLDGRRKAGSIGLPIPNVEVSIQDDSGRELGAGATGELCVRGPNVMLGYWNRPEETAKVMRNGWLVTGDIGHRDADGYYYITDRKKDMLLVNGINVYPREIEEVLYRFPGIKEAAVIGKPDPRKGEQPVAFVALENGAPLDEKALLDFVREKLADYKVPRKVVVLPALPRTATGKVLKTELRTMATA
ncbi:MAG: long-chain fatty acid--CoA ligase [Verrucomicrobia bacterium]|nr:MAG: long-chain fatty acid--CoA ligase [Verrucomicrobiota bacterium]